MSESLLTLSELIVINNKNLADIEVSDLVQDAPVLKALMSQEASNGTKHEYLKEVGAPVVGFRAPNTGRDMSHSQDQLVTINLQILDATFACDYALANKHKKGSQEYLAKEGQRHLRAAFAMAERQFFSGILNDSSGFTGFPDADGLNALGDTMVLDAGGNAGGSIYTSVYAIRTTSDCANACVIMGEEGKITVGDSQIVPWHQLSQGAPISKTYTAYYTPITGWIGLQLGSIHSVARLCNIDASIGATSNTLDDDLLSKLLELFPETAPPTMFVMNKRARGQLQRSRTTYSPTGLPAPLPQEYEGIPIICSGGVSVAEAEVEGASSSSASP